MKFLNKFPSFLMLFTSFCLLLTSVLHYLKTKSLSEYDFILSPFSIGCFLYFSTIIIFLTVSYTKEKYPTKSGFVFIGLSMLKIIAVLIFLQPLSDLDSENKIPNLMYFFIPFFIALFVEIMFIIDVVMGKNK